MFRTAIFLTACLAITAITNAETRWAPGEIIIQLKEGKTVIPAKGKIMGIASLDALNTGHDLMEFSKILPKEDASLPNISKMMVLRFPENADILELCKIYSADFNVVIAEPNYLCELASPPNDPTGTCNGD